MDVALSCEVNRQGQRNLAIWEYLKVSVISLPYIFHVLCVLCFTRPTYQVSVYRTIGPLVYLPTVGRDEVARMHRLSAVDRQMIARSLALIHKAPYLHSVPVY